ncbi:hypothetical protein A2863_04195 [Candidatus Woesebacteria bacterium RIFCSPHIGHO2_01_FULL_38_9b]|uniref:Uncharacterized protein n=1 Tax=Candidatus Woesebacteria bacterium RIFCSPHIGHO2_01_FULL_38_9b TaxID=1802493 RepID=A0A1F7Y3N8_9BACT|nr:MAG: hypothetical protein A2863_04195 [Candidatus Woesebacteria bacterium RIFCSPHIGHO2_01_FULL_38_9b]
MLKIPKGFVHLLLLVVITIIGVSGLLYYSWQKGLINTTPPKNTTPIPTINIDETANWKTYINNEFGFEFKYPERIDVIQYHDNLTSKRASPVLSLILKSPEVSPDYQIPYNESEYQQYEDRYFFSSLSIFEVKVEKNLLENIKALYSTPSIDPQKTEFEIMEQVIEPYLGLPSNALIFVGATKETPQKAVFFPNEKGYLYVISLSGGAGGTGSIYSPTAEKIFDQILSTFEFIDEETGFVCPESKIIDCGPCMEEPCPYFEPQYCSKGSAQYNWILENCPGVEIKGLD